MICFTDNDIVVDEKELEEQVNDLVEIRKKDLLRKNLMNIVAKCVTICFVCATKVCIYFKIMSFSFFL